MMKSCAMMGLLLFVYIFHSGLFGAFTEWPSAPTTLSTSGLDASDPSVVMDLSGNATAVWVENGALLSAEGTASGGWSSSVALTSGSTASLPCAGVDDSGNIIVVWLEGDVVQSLTKSFGQAWATTPEILSGSGASSPQMSINGSGEVIAVWSLSGEIQAISGTFSGGWNSAVTISGSNASVPQVVIDGSGNAVCVWEQVVSSITSIYASTLPSGESWSTAEIISTSGENCASPSIATGSSAFGNAAAIWFSYDLSGSVYSDVLVQTASLTSNGSWQTPVRLEYSPGRCNPTSLRAKIVVDPSGNAVALWPLSEDGALYCCYFASQLAGSNWSSAQMLSAPNALCYAVNLCADANGYVLVAWMERDGSNNIMILTSAAGPQIAQQIVWQMASTLSNSTANGYPVLAMSQSNNVANTVSCWLSYDGTNTTIQGSIGSINEIFPPTALSVSQATNDYGIISEVYNTLTWTASSTPEVSFYRVYRNGLYLGFVMGSDTLEWIDENQGLNESVVYGVQAVTGNRVASTIAQVTWP